MEPTRLNKHTSILTSENEMLSLILEVKSSAGTHETTETTLYLLPLAMWFCNVLPYTFFVISSPVP